MALCLKLCTIFRFEPKFQIEASVLSFKVTLKNMIKSFLVLDAIFDRQRSLALLILSYP